MAALKDRLFMAAIIICALILYLFIGFYQAIINNIRIMRNAATQVADGDLTVRANVKARDEMKLIAGALNSMVDAFSQMVNNAKMLADQSKESTDKVAEIITNIQKDTLISVDRMHKITSEVEEGFEEVISTNMIFKRINDSTDIVVQQIQGISAATEEISASAEEITAQLNEVSNTSKTNMSDLQSVAEDANAQMDRVQTIADLSGDLEIKAKALDNEINRYKI